MQMPYIKVFVDYLDAIEPLGDAERGRLFTSLLEYARSGEVPQLGGNERFIFPMMRAQIDRDRAEMAELSETRSKAGKKGAEAKQANAKFAKQNEQMPDLPKTEKTEKESAPLCPPSLSPPTPPVISPPYNPPAEKEGKELVCAEPLCESASTPPVITLLLNDGTEYPVSVEQCQEWAGLYPAVDVIQQLRKMKAWLKVNPKKRKTRRGVGAFIVNWLSREQDKGHYAPASSQPARSDGNVFLDMLREEEAHGA